MSAAANAIDDGWVLDEPAAALTASSESVDDGWALDEPVVAPPPVLTIVADYADELEADIEIVDTTCGDGWAISDEEAAFFAEGEALATKRLPAEDFSDLGAVKPETGFFKRLFARKG